MAVPKLPSTRRPSTKRPSTRRPPARSSRLPRPRRYRPNAAIGRLHRPGFRAEAGSGKVPERGEECERVSAGVGMGPALEQARDLAGPHLLAEHGQGDAEALGDDGRVDLNIAVLEFDRLHAVPAGLFLVRTG